MQDSSLRRLGGVGAIGVGLLYVGFAGLLAMTPQLAGGVLLLPTWLIWNGIRLLRS